MKYPLFTLGMILCFSYCEICLAWDGFDADSSDLVEVLPDKIPNTGDTVEVRNYETDASGHCIVESVRRNRRTIELVVRDAEGVSRTLVMEGR